MPYLRAIILQISDLHFGENLNKKLLVTLETIVQDVFQELKPESSARYLVVSGDLAENPFPWSMKRACDYIKQIAKASSVEPDHICIIPGNHDYKIMGNWGLGRLSRIPFEIYFRSNGLEIKTGKRLLTYADLALNAIWPWGSKLKDELKVRKDDKHSIAILGFNSTPLFELFAAGKVGSEQILKAKKELTEDEWDRFFTVAVVHHHPLPIPYVSTDLLARLQESFMAFYNAGTFLRELGRNGIDLIIHGHRHFAGFTRVTYDFPDGSRNEIGVLAAGSATHLKPDDTLGNEVNIIRVFDDDTVTIEHLYYSEAVVRKDVNRPFYLYNLDDVSVRRKNSARRKYPLTIRDYTRIVNLTYDGYTQIKFYMKGCKVTGKDAVSEYNDELLAQKPAYIRKISNLSHEESMREIPHVPMFLKVQVDEAQSNLRKQKIKLKFGDAKHETDGKFDLGYTYLMINGHALSAEEFQRKYKGQNVEWEYASIVNCHPCEVMKLIVKFPKDFDMNTVEKFGAEVLYDPVKIENDGGGQWRQHEGETALIRDSVKNVGNELELIVASPVPDFVYRIRWNYTSDKTLPDSRHRSRSGKLKHARERLIEIARNSSKDNKDYALHQNICELLKALCEDIAEHYTRIDDKENLDISLAIFDDNNSVLRFVAVCPDRIPDIYKITFLPGEGCVGFSFEKNRILCYHRGNEPIGYHIEPEEIAKEQGITASLPKYETLLVCPWMDTVTGEVLGAVCIGSNSKSSRFLKIFDLDDSGLEKEKERLKGLTNALGEAIIELI